MSVSTCSDAMHYMSIFNESLDRPGFRNPDEKTRVPRSDNETKMLLNLSLRNK